MKKEKGWGEVFILGCLLITPVGLVWAILGGQLSEPVGYLETIELVIILIVTGFGGLGIGKILVDEYERRFKCKG